MKPLDEILKETVPKYFRFQVYGKDKTGKTKKIGMAYLREGQNLYTLRLWTFLDNKFYVLPSKEDPKAFLVLTREPHHSKETKKRFFWKVVGSGAANASQSSIDLDFDLFDKSISMSLLPEL